MNLSQHSARTDVKALYASAKSTLLYKQGGGGGHVAWSAAWEACLWARLGEAERVWGALLRINSGHVTPRLLTLHTPTERTKLRGFGPDSQIDCTTCITNAKTDSNGKLSSYIPERGMLTLDKSAVSRDALLLSKLLISLDDEYLLCFYFCLC